MRILRISATTILFLLLALPFAGGCGGGTRGTGGVDREILSRVVTADNTPIPGLNVTLIEAGAQGVTDSNGSVSFTTTVAGDLQFVIQAEGVNITITVAGVPAESELVVVTFEVDRESNSGKVRDVESEDHGDGGSGSNGSSNNSSADDDEDDNSSSSAGNSSSDSSDDDGNENDDESDNDSSSGSSSSQGGSGGNSSDDDNGSSSGHGGSSGGGSGSGESGGGHGGSGSGGGSSSSSSSDDD